MKHLTSNAIAATALMVAVATTAQASDGVLLTNANKARIVEKLSADGYEVRRVKVERGLFEAYALKDGQRYEVLLDADLNTVRTKGND